MIVRFIASQSEAQVFSMMTNRRQLRQIMQKEREHHLDLWWDKINKNAINNTLPCSYLHVSHFKNGSQLHVNIKRVRLSATLITAAYIGLAMCM